MIGRVAAATHEEMLDLAKRLSAEAAAISLPNVGRAVVRRKSDATVVTDVDHEIQAHIIKAVREAFPDHAIIGEETVLPAEAGPAPPAPESRFCWVIDPLDGTRNYVAGLPIFATSIAVLDAGVPVVGVVYEHNLGNEYAAARGEGATLNGRPISVVDPAPGEDFILGVPSSKDSITVGVIREWAGTRGFICRNVGATAVHLATVASGTLAGAFSNRCKIWDIAAGWLIVREAGGLVTGLFGDECAPFALDADPNADTPFLAGSPATHARLLETTRAFRR